MQPLVTISIPLYKCEDFLNACLESVRAQTYSNIEVTLINDQTPDNSVEIAENFIKNNDLKNWKIYHLEKNSGLSVVRNKGIDTAEGKYLFFLDSDDTITPDCISSLVEIAEKTGAEMTISQLECEQLETGEKSICIKIQSEKEVITGKDEILKDFANGDLVTYAVNKLFLVDFIRINKIYFIPGLFAQDELWTFHLILKLNKIAIHKGITYTYFLHQKSVIHNRDKRHFDNWGTIVSHFDAALKSENQEETSALIRTHMINYKTMTLIMNWKAKKKESEWIYSFNLYKKYPNLRFRDYFRSNYSFETKKKALKLELPTSIAIRLFKYMYYR
ncbi:MULTISPECIES: glycosyltransferase [unclassified Kaistella]|uniref:glycosyltransferase n=1 Tax=unclassified Kaistella TaxID=2762626 RepID=UPI002736CE96|nr:MULTISPECIES: glycosyltransferase [unclassified Kaistella]MDP2454937.1 glycosyltransferase [Kaistella sp. SH11-4b]MDP2456080.1 glycosyltransferase [Kaistella sp. SH40-3]MDP2460607.1 glycosyltransferase [Kaistella sp. SH19-2b]